MWRMEIYGDEDDDDDDDKSICLSNCTNTNQVYWKCGFEVWL